MSLTFNFDNPEYISNGNEPDKLVIKFYNTTKYLKAVDTSKDTIPDGY